MGRIAFSGLPATPTLSPAPLYADIGSSTAHPPCTKCTRGLAPRAPTLRVPETQALLPGDGLSGCEWKWAYETAAKLPMQEWGGPGRPRHNLGGPWRWQQREGGGGGYRLWVQGTASLVASEFRWLVG